MQEAENEIENLNESEKLKEEEILELESEIEINSEKLNESKNQNKKLKNKNEKLNDEKSKLEKELKNKKKEIEKIKVSKANSKKESINTSSKSTSSKSTKAIYNMNATHYSANCPTCGQWKGVTALGDNISNTIYVNGMRVIAVDPNVIPLGSEVVVSGAGYNFKALARDTGGDIKGNRIDILVNSTEEAYKLGRKDVKVQVLN